MESPCSFHLQLQTAENVGAAYDAISVLFVKLEDFTTRLKVHATQEISDELRNIFIQILTTLLDILALSAKRIRNGSRLKKYFELALLGNDSKIDAAVSRLERLVENELMMTVTETLSQVNRSAKAIDRIKECNKDIRDTLEHMQDNKLVERIKAALSPELDAFAVYEKHKREILKGSGEWIWEERVFSDWIEGKMPVLWIYGFPGAGKSFLSFSVVQSLQKLHPQGIQDTSLTSVAYFFCKNDQPNLRSLDSALRTIAYQITKNDPIYAKHILGKLDFIGDCKSSTRFWNEAILNYFNRKDGKSSVYIVVDALDEMEEDDRTLFFEMLKSLTSQNQSSRIQNVHVMLVGRSNITEELETAMEILPPMIEVNSSKNSADIEHYIQNFVNHSAKLKRRPISLRKEIVEKLSAGANGFFLWATLMLKEVQSKDRPDQIRKTLNNLPNGLTNTLRQVVARFSRTLDEDQIDDLNVKVHFSSMRMSLTNLSTCCHSSFVWSDQCIFKN